ncbi:MAG: hypothetical protein EP349_10485 [Alphaproteobacteria bacterium]|nr:MAG: hypothetical protein EP349_10485 [Alphaproteobacteria bacterium]
MLHNIKAGKEMLKKAGQIVFAAILGLLTVLPGGCAAPYSVPPQVNAQAVQQETLEQKKLLYKRAEQDNDRVARIAFPLMTANTAFCGRNVVAFDGLSGWTLDAFPPQEQQMARQLFGLGAEVTLSQVVKGSPGDKAGLRKGDVLVSVNGVRLMTGRQGLKQASDLMQQAGLRPSQIHFMRGGKIANTTLTPVQSCAFSVYIDQKASNLNAYADGQNIVVSRGMMRFVESDTELALVIAHELAHNAMGHVDKKKNNALTGALGGLAIDALLGAAGVSTGGQFGQVGMQAGAMSYSVAFEQEADYIGMYFMERAGFDTANVATFWRRMAVEQGNAAIQIRSTHPTSPERFVAISRTHEEIQTKRKRGQALAPNMQRR